MKKNLAAACRFIIDTLILGAILFFVLIIKNSILAETAKNNFPDILYSALYILYFYMPIFYALSVIEIFSYSIRKQNLKFSNLILLLFILITMLAFVQPVLFSQREKIENKIMLNESVNPELEKAVQLPEILENIKADTEKFLQDLNNACKKSYICYLIFVAVFFFLVFSFWSFTVNVKWKILNVIIIFALFRFFLFLYAYICSTENFNYFSSVFGSEKYARGVLYLTVTGIGLLLFIKGFIVTKITKRKKQK